MSKESSRHHYLPKFYVRGFLNIENKLYVYDKQEDKIKSKSVSANSIFFEWNRNNITVKGKILSTIERLYSEIDDKCAGQIKALMENENKIGLLTTERIAFLKYFMLHLLWRVPFTDKSFEDVYRRSKFIFDKTNTNGQIQANFELQEFIESKEGEKLARVQYVDKMIIESIKSSEVKNSEFYSRIYEFDKEYFLIGDQPIVFNGTIENFTELMEVEYILPLSSKRIISSRKKDDKKFWFYAK